MSHSESIASHTARHSRLQIMRNAIQTLLLILGLISLNACDRCEVKGTVTFDNTDRVWCNCEVTHPNGDVYVVDAGETRTHEFWRGSHTFIAYCGNEAFGNDLCGFEEETRSEKFEIDCEDEWVMDLNF